MPGIHITRVEATARIKVPEQALEQRLVASPYVVGEELATQVDDYVRREKLGYYPPLDFFSQVDHGIDPDLLTTMQGISWFVDSLVRSEVTNRLRGAFSHVGLNDIHLVAFTMPGVRPNNPNALHELGKHFTPDDAKVTLAVSTIERRAHIEGIEKLAAHKIVRWLEPHFEAVNVTSAQAQ